MLSALVSNWRVILIVVGLIASGLGGWKVNAWRVRALEADKLQAERDTAIKRERASDAARMLLSAQVEEYATQTRIEVQEVIKHVPVYINKSDCTLSVDGLRALNDARGVPRPSR